MSSGRSKGRRGSEANRKEEIASEADRKSVMIVYCALDHFLRGEAWCFPARDYRAVAPDRSLPLLTDEDIIGRLTQLGVLELAFPTLLKIIRAAQTCEFGFDKI